MCDLVCRTCIFKISMDQWLLLKYLQTILPLKNPADLQFSRHFVYIDDSSSETPYARSLSLVTILRVIPMATKRKYSIWTPFKTIRDIEFPCDASNEVFMIDNGKECCLVYYKESWNSSSIPFILSVFYLDAELSVRCW